MTDTRKFEVKKPAAIIEIKQEKVDATSSDNALDDKDKNKNLHKCELCRKQFSSKSCLSFHYSCHFPDISHACQACGQSFSQVDDLADHYAQEHCNIDQQDEYDCFSCGLSFDDKAKFDEHQRSHELSCKDFSCEICLESFETENKLRGHYSEHIHRSYTCNICHKEFKYRSSLSRHVLIHQEEKPFQCEICNVGFTQKITLQNHVLIHKKIKPFECSLCNKTFATKSSIDSHLVNHSGERPFVCFICDNSFTTKKALKRHGIEHMPDEYSVCDICGKGFATKFKLKLHFMLHTNERPFKCSICSRGFTYSSHLKRHMLWHRGEKPHVCTVCGAAFITKFRLTGHYQRHINEWQLMEEMEANEDVSENFVPVKNKTYSKSHPIQDSEANNSSSTASRNNFQTELNFINTFNTIKMEKFSMKKDSY